MGSYEMDPLEAITMLALTNALTVNCFLFYYLEGEVYAVEKKPPWADRRGHVCVMDFLTWTMG